MRGCSDLCAQMVHRIRIVGVKDVKAKARELGRTDPDADMALVSKAYLLGYEEAGRQSGWSEAYTRRLVGRYAEYAEAVLRDRERRANGNADT